MSWPDRFSRIVPYLGRRRAGADLEEEMRLHLELERDRLVDAGLDPAAAARLARRRLGNPVLIREDTRSVWGWRRLDALARDLRHVARGLRRSPGFTAIVVAVLALGIGATTAVFSLVHGVLLSPLPFRDPGQLVTVQVHIREMEDRFPAFPANHRSPPARVRDPSHARRQAGEHSGAGVRGRHEAGGSRTGRRPHGIARHRAVPRSAALRGRPHRPRGAHGRSPRGARAGGGGLPGTGSPRAPSAAGQHAARGVNRRHSPEPWARAPLASALPHGTVQAGPSAASG